MADCPSGPAPGQDARVLSHGHAQPALFSCLCVTENREAFLPWLLWNFERQDWPRKELVIVDSSTQRLHLPARSDIRVIRAEPGARIADKRNLALEASRGRFLTWFDDDDWQHPRKLSMLAGAMRDGAALAGGTRSWFVSLAELRSRVYSTRGERPIFNGAGFRRAQVETLRFDPRFRRGSDTVWMRRVWREHGARCALIEDEALFFWLCHERNISNPVWRRRFYGGLELVRERISDADWGDTDAALQALTERLGLARPSRGPTPAQQARATHPVAPASESRALVPVAPAPPRVSAMVRMRASDAVFAEHTVPHLLAQARHDFAERVLLLDFTAPTRPRQRAFAERLAASLLQRRVVDRVDTLHNPEHALGPLAQVLELHPRGWERLIRARSPWAALSHALLTTSTRYLAWFESDLLFHSSGPSWVDTGLEALQADPSLWLMMSHPGPPLGPRGASLIGANQGAGQWDEAPALWRFRSATTRYFLAEPGRLTGRVRPLDRDGRWTHPAQAITELLQREGGTRGNAGRTDSWHLHVAAHGPPFPRWAPAIVEAVTAGDIPRRQRGRFDLRLDDLRDRAAWRALLRAREGQPQAPSTPSHPAAGEMTWDR